MSKTLSSKQRNLYFTHTGAQKQYDTAPPMQDLIPAVSYANARSFIVEYYLGIEENLRFLINLAKQQGRNSKKATSGHNLEPLFYCLPSEDRKLLSARYRTYWSLQSRACYSTPLPGEDNEDLERKLSDRFNQDYEEFMKKFCTLDKFLQTCGDGYNKWRYWPLETKQEDPQLPHVNLDLMLEVWRSLVWLSARRLREKSRNEGVSTYVEAPVDIFLNEYLHHYLYRSAEDDDEWQQASLDDTSAIEFSDLHDWFWKRPSVKGSNTPVLVSGLEVLNAQAGWTDGLEGATGELERVLLRAGPSRHRRPAISTEYRLSDIQVFHRRIRTEGCAWDADAKEFHPLP